MQNPWQNTDSGTRRTAKGKFLRLVDTSTVLANVNGKTGRYPLDRVVVQGRFKVCDVGEYDAWTTISFGDSKS